jgi:hypothetical protein
MIRPIDPISIKVLLPNLSIKRIARSVNMKFTIPIPAVDSNAELSPNPVISNIRGA